MAAHQGVIDACERSLRRLETETIDLYLLHWPGSHPLSETFGAFHALREAGKILEFGVSNFDLDDLEDIPAEDQNQLGCNQVFYNLAHRETEWSVTDWCRKRGVPIMAYSPLDQAGSVLKSSVLSEIAARHEASNAQIALAWLLHQPQNHRYPQVGAARSASGKTLPPLTLNYRIRIWSQLDSAYPPPASPTRLGMR